MKTFDKLAERIENEFGLKTRNYRRLRPGFWQRSAGAWSWVANEINEDGNIMPYDIGSTYPASDLLKHKGKLVMCRDREIVPDN